ncbi:MAG TPA: JAB domain-containing protein [Paucimonas sp.]|nr:JAB domain-containing protein [Paucimonas sp.]
MSGVAPSPRSSLALSPHEIRALRRASRILEKRFATTPHCVLDEPAAVSHYLRFRFAGMEREEFHALWLTAMNHLIAAECLFVGTVTRTAVYPREIVKQALRHNASAVIFAHNHPSGSAVPSKADIALTKALREALRVVDVSVHDHFVVTERETISTEGFAHRR